MSAKFEDIWTVYEHLLKYVPGASCGNRTDADSTNPREIIYEMYRLREKFDKSDNLISSFGLYADSVGVKFAPRSIFRIGDFDPVVTHDH